MGGTWVSAVLLLLLLLLLLPISTYLLQQSVELADAQYCLTSPQQEVATGSGHC
jgi:ABC-type sulfate transport system permease component